MLLKRDKFETREEAEASYDLQIELLLRDRMMDWGSEVNYQDWIDGHYGAWLSTGDYPRSLFTEIVGCPHCAATIESSLMPRNRALPAKILADAPFLLMPAVNRVCGDAQEKFTRDELLEFKRRQLLAAWE